jgi:hypothetical protein
MEDAQSLFILVDRLVGARPLTATSTARLVGSPLRPAVDESTERTLVYAARGTPGFERVELRVAGPRSTNNDQLLILELDGSRCIKPDDMRRRYGADPQPGVPTPHQPADAPLYFRYPIEAGTLSFGFARGGEECLKSVVLDLAAAK